MDLSSLQFGELLDSRTWSFAHSELVDGADVLQVLSRDRPTNSPGIANKPSYIRAITTLSSNPDPTLGLVPT